MSLRPSFSEESKRRLAELSAEIFGKVGELRRAVPGERTREGIAELLSGMNSYYSNLIEGVKTYPEEVAAAMREEFSEKVGTRERQALAVAHIKTEERMRRRLVQKPDLRVHDPDFLSWIHRDFYGGLPESARVTQTQSGNFLPVEPGMFRDRGVSVGSHRPPEAGKVVPILNEFARYFSQDQWLATDGLMMAAAAHHRVAWVHPFLDGNGRVARFYSHACLIQAGVDGAGLWSLSRGFARERGRYYEALSAADRREPFENRERLSEDGLGVFAEYFLETLLDQVEFMSGLLELNAMSARIDRFVHFELAPRKHGESLVRLLRALLIEGEVARGDVKQITGLQDTAAREVINLAFSHGLVASPSPKGRLALAFPPSVLESYFPRLYLDLVV